jgi:hypothetical protein
MTLDHVGEALVGREALPLEPGAPVVDELYPYRLLARPSRARRADDSRISLRRKRQYRG